MNLRVFVAAAVGVGTCLAGLVFGSVADTSGRARLLAHDASALAFAGTCNECCDPDGSWDACGNDINSINTPACPTWDADNGCRVGSDPSPRCGYVCTSGEDEAECEWTLRQALCEYGTGFCADATGQYYHCIESYLGVCVCDDDDAAPWPTQCPNTKVTCGGTPCWF